MIERISGQSMPIPNAEVARTMRSLPFGSQIEDSTFSFIYIFDALVYMSIRRNSGKSGYFGGNVKWSPSLC